MSTHLQIRVADTLLPLPLLETLQVSEPATPVAQEVQEKCMVAAATLIVALILDTNKVLRQKKIKKLDANAGDGGCQLRALILKKLLASPEVIEEGGRLEEQATKTSTVLQLRRSRNGHFTSNDETASSFFAQQIRSLKSSKELFYLFNCRLLMMTKIVDHKEPNGIIVTKTDPSRLVLLSKNINMIDGKLRKMLLSDAAAKCSEDSLRFLQEISSCMTLSPVIHRMLSVVRHNRPEVHYKPKSFGCLFYEMQAILTHLRQQQAVIAIKAIGLLQTFFMRPKGPGEEFALEEQLEKFSGDSLITVFAGVISPNLSQEAFVKKVHEVGFSHLILACSAQEPPFEPGSSLDDVEDREARAEINTFREKAETIGCLQGHKPLLQLDHIFCNTLEEELQHPEENYVIV